MAIIQNPNNVILSGMGVPGYEPVLKHRFVFNIIKGPSGSDPMDQKAQWAVKTFTSGSKTVDSANYQMMNRQIKFPTGRAAQESVSLGIILYGGRTNPAYKYFWDWFKKIYNDQTDEVGLITDRGDTMGGTGELLSLNTDGTTALKIIYNNMWPSKFKISDMDRSSEVDPVIAEVTFEVNEWELEF